MISFDYKWERKQISNSSINQKHHCHPAALTIHDFGVQGTLFHISLVLCFSNCAKCTTSTTERASEQHTLTAQIFSCFLHFLTTTALPEQTQLGIPALGSVIPESSSLRNRANRERLSNKLTSSDGASKTDIGLQTTSPAYLVSCRISGLSPGSQHGTGNAPY